MTSVTEVKQSPGRWDLQLDRSTPRAIIDALTPFGHIAIAPGRIDVGQVGDNLLRQARYVGVYRGGKVAGEEFSLEGSGMAFWVGDEDGKGPIIESVSASAATFAQTINLILPAAVTAGTLYSVPGSATLNHTFQWETAKSALNFATNAFSTPTIPVSWRVNGDATLDAGPDSSLYNLNPTSILVRKDAVLRTGRGADVTGISGDLQLETAYSDYTTKVIVLGAGEGDATIAGSASLAASAVLYNDMHGNKVSFTRLVDDLDADGVTLAPAIAASLLSRFDSFTQGATLSSDDYDVRGDFNVGDHVAVFDPDIGFVDYSHEMYYEGVPINPTYLQVQGITWPVETGFTVGFRDMSGTWLDLTDHYKPASGQTLIDVGDNPSGLTSLGFDIDRGRVVADASVPATPVFGTFYSSNYLNTAGDTRSQVLVTWTKPLNSDGSTIIDGHHYEIRYRPNVTAPYPATWGEAAQNTWGGLFTWMQPRVPPFTTTEWHVVEAPFDVEQRMILELLPSVIYEFQIRAVDGANPPNRSAWSASQAITAARDTLPPTQPAAPVVAASRLSLQVIHYLGRNDGGTFNLDRDLQWLEIHASNDPFFFPSETTLAGRVPAAAALAAQTPVVASVLVEDTIDLYVRVVAVDRDGNRSNASEAAQSSALLIDDSHISDLTASKITAGTISANLLLSGSIRTAQSGSRVELNASGLQAFDTDGDLTTSLSSDPALTGQFLSLLNDGRTLATINEEGVASFQRVYVNEAFVGGTNIIDGYVELRPRGVVAYGRSFDDVSASAANTRKGYLEIAFDAESGRTYEVVFQGEVESTSANIGERYIFDIYDGGTSMPSLASTNLGGVSFAATGNAGRNDTGSGSLILNCPDDITVGQHRLLWAFLASEGTPTMRGTDGPSYFYVKDVGPTDFYDNVAVLNNGAGGSTAVSKTYTVTYPCTWSATYGDYGGGSKQLLDLTYVGQGESPTYGETMGLFGFSSQIATDLAGATVKRIAFTAYAHWWSKTAGGTAILGYHNYTSVPDALSGARMNEDEQEVEEWPKPGFVTTVLNSSFRTAFQAGAGTATGIVVGRAPSTATVYRAHFDGITEPYPASLQITYTK
jgi:hypothetical protein